MALFGETANLAVELNLKGNFTQQVNQAKTSLGGLGKQAQAGTAGIGKMSQGVGGLTAKIKGLAGPAKQSILSGFGLGGGLLAFGAVTSAVGATVNILSDAVRMAAEEETAIKQLTVAIEANDRAWDGNIDAVEELITQRQKLAFSDGEQRESLQLLVGYTKDLAEAENVLGTAMDFARYRNIDLRTASDLLGKAMAGNTSLLSRYGIVVKRGASATEVLTEVQKLAAGQALAYAEGPAGKLARSQIAIDDAMEELGKTITPLVADLAGLAAETIPDLVQSAKDAVEWVSNLTDGFIDLGRSLGDIVGRDLVNDIANTMRIAGTGGVALFTDAVGKLQTQGDPLNNVLEDWVGKGTLLGDVWHDLAGEGTLVGDSVTDLGRDLGLTAERFDVLSGVTVDAYDAMDALTKANEAASASYDPLSSITTETAKRMAALAAATEEARQRFNAFRQSASEIAESRSLGELNKELSKQRRLRRQAAAAGKVAAFAAAQAAITQLNGEKKLRRQGKSALSEWIARKRKEKKTQQGVTNSIDKTTDAAKKLDRVDPKVKVSVPGAEQTLSILRTIRTAVINIPGNRQIDADVVGGRVQGSGIGMRAQGGPVQAFKTYRVNEQGTEYFTPQQNGYIHDARTTRTMMSGGGGNTAVYVTPTLMIAASQVEEQGTKVIRTHRFREKN